MATRRCDMTDVDLLLIGKTGNGKSATGNSILGRKAFVSKSSFESVTTTIDSEYTEYKGRTIRVVDTPGVGDTRIDEDGEAKEFVMKALQRAIAVAPLGYHAFLFVIRFGGRYTQEDQDTLDFLKQIFGKDFVRRFCILVLSYGDNYYRDMEDTGLTFKQWCQEQTGIFTNLYKECEYRVVLFDNGTRYKAQKEEQLDRLLEVIDSLWTPGHRYRDENFEEAAKARRTIMVELKLPVITDEVMKAISLIQAKFEQILTLDIEAKESPLKFLVTKCSTLYSSVSDYAEGTEVLDDLKTTIFSLQKTVEDELKLCQRMTTEKKKIHQTLFRQVSTEMDDWKKQFEQEQLAQKRQVLETQELYRKLKKKHMKGIAERVVDVVTWPLRITAKGFDKAGRKVTGKSKKDASSFSDC